MLLFCGIKEKKKKVKIAENLKKNFFFIEIIYF